MGDDETTIAAVRATYATGARNAINSVRESVDTSRVFSLYAAEPNTTVADAKNQLRELFDTIRAVLDRLSADPLESRDTASLNIVGTHLNELATLVAELSNTDAAGQGNPGGWLKRWIGPIREKTYSLRSSYAALVSEVGSDARINELVATLKSRLEQATSDIEKAKADAQKVTAEIKALAPDAGIAAQAQHFATRAGAHERGAKNWLGWTVALAVLALAGAGVAIYVGEPNGLTPAAVVRFAAMRVVAVSVLLGALVWCARNYRAHRHNAVLNEYRAASLSTFQTIARAADDPATKAAVLLKAVDAIFGAQPTGYLPSDPEPMPNAIAVDILQRVIASQGRTPGT